MKQAITLTLLVFSLCINAQGDILELVHQANSQPERITGYSKMVALSYGVSYDDNASVDTTVMNPDGSKSELSLTKKTVTIINGDTDIAYEIDMITGDTSMVTTSVFNEKGKLITQKQHLGDDAASQMFNSTKTFIYDDQNRVIQLINKSGQDGDESGATFTYHKDGLPQSLSMSMGMGKFNMNREEMDGYFKYSVTGEMSAEMIEMIKMMGKSVDDMPKEFYEVRETNGLYEVKHMKEKGDDKILTHQSTTTRDKDGNVHEDIRYHNGEISSHTKYEYVDGKLKTITDIMEDTTKTVDYDDNGRPLVEYENFGKDVITYNADGMISTRSSSLFDDEINGLEVIQYFK